MCEVSSSVAVLVGPETRRIDEPVPARVSVDECIAEEVAELNSAGIRTVGSCCGHGAGALERWIAIAGEDAGQALELGYERRPTPRGFPNYAGAVTVMPRGSAEGRG